VDSILDSTALPLELPEIQCASNQTSGGYHALAMGQNPGALGFTPIQIVCLKGCSSHLSRFF
jgi:hypothetical protein